MNQGGPSGCGSRNSLVEGNKSVSDGWSHVVASLLAQHTALLQKLAAATFVGPAFPVCLPLPTAQQRSAAAANVCVQRQSDWDRRKWRNRRNRHRKKLRRLFSNVRKEPQQQQQQQHHQQQQQQQGLPIHPQTKFSIQSREVRETQVQRMLQSVIR